VASGVTNSVAAILSMCRSHRLLAESETFRGLRKDCIE